MLRKLFGVRKPKPSRKPTSISGPAPPGEGSAALRIVHAGGRVDSYYMAVPANRVMEKYPSFVLGRPDIFRRPWDAVVRPDEILVPGQKFFVVPRQTVKKLRRKIHKPCGESSTSCSFTNVSAEISQLKDDFSSKSFLKQSDAGIGSSKTNGKKSSRRAIEDSNSLSTGENSKTGQGQGQGGGGKTKARNVVMWHPTLTSIREFHGSTDESHL